MVLLVFDVKPDLTKEQKYAGTCIVHVMMSNVYWSNFYFVSKIILMFIFTFTIKNFNNTLIIFSNLWQEIFATNRNNNALKNEFTTESNVMDLIFAKEHESFNQ